MPPRPRRLSLADELAQAQAHVERRPGQGGQAARLRQGLQVPQGAFVARRSAPRGQEEEARRVRRDKGCDKSGGRGDEAVDQHGEVKVTSFQDRTYDGSDLSPAELGQNFGWGHLPLPRRPC